MMAIMAMMAMTAMVCAGVGLDAARVRYNYQGETGRWWWWWFLGMMTTMTMLVIFLFELVLNETRGDDEDYYQGEKGQ